MVAGVLIGIPATASASTCFNWTGVQPPSPGGFDNNLFGVAVLSRCNAWAVGAYYNDEREIGQTLIEHWNGTAWKRVASPNPSGTSNYNILNGVVALSASNAWAVGESIDGTGVHKTLIEHWTGTAWKLVPSPNPSSSGNTLYGVGASSATNIWAVGTYNGTTAGQALALHCC